MTPNNVSSLFVYLLTACVYASLAVLFASLWSKERVGVTAGAIGVVFFGTAALLFLFFSL